MPDALRDDDPELGKMRPKRVRQHRLLPDQQRCDYLFLANISPELQYRVLSQVMNPKLVAADTMDFWIQNARPHLTRLLERLG